MADAKVFHWKTALEPEALSHFVHIVEPVYEAMARLNEPGGRVPLASGPSSEPWVAVEKCGIPFAGGVVSPTRLPSRYDPPHPPWPLPARAERLARARTGLRLLYGLDRGLRALSR